MSNNELFMKAAKQKYRFESNKGLLTVEQLFDLPLTQLDLVAQAVDDALEAAKGKSFIKKANPAKAQLEDKLNIAVAIIELKQAEAEAARVKKANAEEARKLMDAIEQIKTRELSSASVEDLEKRLNALTATL